MGEEKNFGVFKKKKGPVSMQKQEKHKTRPPCW